MANEIRKARAQRRERAPAEGPPAECTHRWMGGRCVDCGACDRACPVGISLRALNSKLSAETKDLFACVAGFDCQKKAPLLEFLPGDTEKALDTH